MATLSVVFSRRSSRFGRGLLLSVGLAIQCAGCAIVEVHSADGTTNIHRYGGILAIDVRPGEDNQLLKSHGIGLIRSSGGIILGYHHVDAAKLGRECRVVFWIKSREELEAAAKLLSAHDASCALSTEDEK